MKEIFNICERRKFLQIESSSTRICRKVPVSQVGTRLSKYRTEDLWDSLV
uniref:Uncharacterized protein n=1 Tax=Octopus bimaculoides TaxID=37653 RepID=A0A0L8GBP1_OCTBM